MTKTITGSGITGFVATIRTRDVDSLVAVQRRGLDDAKPFDVFAVVPSGTGAMVAGPFTESEAVAYVIDDPDGIL